jgi:hypothetical protein
MFTQKMEEFRDMQATLKEMTHQHDADLALIASMEEQNKKAKINESRLEQLQLQVP